MVWSDYLYGSWPHIIIRSHRVAVSILLANKVTPTFPLKVVSVFVKFTANSFLQHQFSQIDKVHILTGRVTAAMHVCDGALMHRPSAHALKVHTHPLPVV